MANDISYYQYSRPEVAALIPDNVHRILEIGCGVGNFRKNLSGEYEYWGVEPAAEVATRAAAHLGKVLVGTYKDVFTQIPDNYFDLVICNDVVEHMDDHDWFLQSIRKKMMDKNSVLIGSIPNVRYVDNLFNLLIKRDWEYVDMGILDKTHLRFFTQKSLLRTFHSNNYSVEEFKGINGVEIAGAKSMTSLFRRLLALVAVAILGRDTRFPQFAFRVSPNVDAI